MLQLGLLSLVASEDWAARLVKASECIVSTAPWLSPESNSSPSFELHLRLDLDLYLDTPSPNPPWTRFDMAPGRLEAVETPRDAIDIASARAPNGFDTGGENGLNDHPNSLVDGKPKNWIPIAEHVLWKPTKKVKLISIGCGFSGTCWVVGVTLARTC